MIANSQLLRELAASVRIGEAVMSTRPSFFQFRIPSEPAEARQAIDTLLARLDNYGFDERQMFGVRQAVEEACANAIKHGNGDDRTKSIRFEYYLTTTLIRIAVEDEGDGFNPNQVADPRTSDQMSLPSGRGLLLMRSYMTNVEFNSMGNKVVMELHRADQP